MPDLRRKRAAVAGVRSAAARVMQAHSPEQFETKTKVLDSAIDNYQDVMSQSEEAPVVETPSEETPQEESVPEETPDESATPDESQEQPAPESEQEEQAGDVSPEEA